MDALRIQQPAWLSARRFVMTTLLCSTLMFIIWIHLEGMPQTIFRDPSFDLDDRAKSRLLFTSNIEASIEAARREWGCTQLPSDNSTYDNRKKSPVISLRHMDPPQFLPNYKNPCWYPDPNNTTDVPFCLPYFYVAGFPKCGTTDLYVRLTQHPLIVEGRYKEPHYFTKKMHVQENCTRRYTTSLKALTNCIVQYYVNYYFHKSAVSIQRNKKIESPDDLLPPRIIEEWRNVTVQAMSTVDHPMVTVDGSASTSFQRDLWSYLAENQGCSLPAVITAHILARLNPKVKVIFILRDPTARLYSEYLYFRGRKDIKISPTQFHDLAVQSIQNFNKCTENEPIKLCLLWSKNHGPLQLKIGLYQEQLDDWFQLLPASQIHIIHSESYKGNIQGTLNNAFEFLGLPTLSRPALNFIAKRTPKQKDNYSSKSQYGEMLPETKALLRNFYSKYNENLARYLQDDRFAWRS